MQRRGGRGGFFDLGDTFSGFGGFGGLGGSLLSNFFEKDPFDDPFFTHPFGSVFGPSMFGQSFFGAGGSPFGQTPVSGFIEHQPQQPKKSKGPIIRELSPSEEDKEEEDETDSNEKKSSPRKHARQGKEPIVQEPDDEREGRKRKLTQFRNEYDRTQRMPPQTQSFMFHSSTVTYGGGDGQYYMSSTTRRTGSDGLTVEENREADTTTGTATHRLSRGIQDKGHSVKRKLNSDGRVDTVQTLHNLNEAELVDFEESWKGKAKKHLPGWNLDANMLSNGHGGTSDGLTSRGWALPSTESSKNEERLGLPAKPRAKSFRGRH